MDPTSEAELVVTGVDYSEILEDLSLDKSSDNKFKFTRVNAEKTLKGFLIAMTGSAGAYILAVVGNLDFPPEYSFVPGLIATLVNMIREYLKA